jgi:hypothetical protein
MARQMIISRQILYFSFYTPFLIEDHPPELKSNRYSKRVEWGQTTRYIPSYLLRHPIEISLKITFDYKNLLVSINCFAQIWNDFI